MSCVTSFGAYNKDTNEYVIPTLAKKQDKYICTECKDDLVLCQGEIKAHYFRHKANESTCTKYTKPTETQIHEDAKLFMRLLIDTRRSLKMCRTCDSCKKKLRVHKLESSKTGYGKIEHRFEYNGTKIADVAHIDNDMIQHIFEIYHTNKTPDEDRPEPWFEIDAGILMKKKYKKEMVIPCKRYHLCKECKIIEEKRKSNTRTYNAMYDYDSADEDSLWIEDNVYFKVKYENKHRIKEFKARWNQRYKLWYLTNKNYKKLCRVYTTISEREKYIGSEIIWKDETCEECEGDGYYMEHLSKDMWSRKICECSMNIVDVDEH